jgi:hypothetical protein
MHCRPWWLHRVPRTLAASGALACALFAPTTPCAQIQPTTVDEICPPAANPCVVDQVVGADNLSVMDFGTRTVRIVPGGQLAIANNSVELHCGRLEVDTSSLALHMVLPVQPGAAISGSLEVRAYRQCSDNNAVRCIVDTDCAAGTCNVGDGSIVFDGVVNGRATVSANLTLIAAGSVDVPGKIFLSGLTSQPEGQTDGGDLTIEATAGPVSLTGRLSAAGSGFGGSLRITSGSNVSIHSGIHLDGEFPGSVDIIAGGEVLIDGKIRSSNTTYGGFGGQSVEIAAGGAVAIGSDKFRADVRGGQFNVTADGDVVVASDARIRTAGPQGGPAGDVAMSSGGSLTVDGSIATGGGFGTSTLALAATQTLLLPSSSKLSASSRGTGGTVTLSGASVLADGRVTSKGGKTSGTFAGSISIAGGDVSIGGRLSVIGDAAAVADTIDVTGCAIELKPGATLSIAVETAGFHALAAEQLTIENGARVSSPTSGVNEIEYRGDGPVPVVLGDVTPVPTVIPVALAPCP